MSSREMGLGIVYEIFKRLQTPGCIWEVRDTQTPETASSSCLKSV